VEATQICKPLLVRAAQELNRLLLTPTMQELNRLLQLVVEELSNQEVGNV
jgi:hypothetical protein